MLLIFLLVIIIIPLTIILLLAWLISKKKIFGELAGYLWLSLFGLIAMLCITKFLTSKTELDKEDIYGEYVIDKSQFAGKQADWQYNHYRFEITKDNKVLFHITEKEKIIKTIPGTVAFNDYYTSPRINLKFEEPGFHIIEENPTLFREIWSFYYVFESPEYGNVFFKKGTWKSDKSYF